MCLLVSTDMGLGPCTGCTDDQALTGVLSMGKSLLHAFHALPHVILLAAPPGVSVTIPTL